MMREKLRKLMFVLLSLCVMIAVITLVPAGGKKGEVNAEGETTGDYSNGVTWEWDEAQNKLIFKYSGTGSGIMIDYPTDDDSINKLPFSIVKDKKNVSVEIQDGVTRIGIRTFLNHNYMGSVTIADSVKSIDKDAFANCNNLSIISGGNGIEYSAGIAFNIADPTANIYGSTGKSMTYLYSDSEYMEKMFTEESKRIRVNKITLMDYEGTSKLLEFGLPVSDSMNFLEMKRYAKNNNIKDEDVPYGIAVYSWYKKANGTIDDCYLGRNYSFNSDTVLYGKPIKQIDWVYDFDVSDGKKIVMDPRELDDSGQNIREALMHIGIYCTLQAAFADATKTDINSFDADEFRNWIYGNTLYFNPVPASEMQPNEKMLAEGFYSSVTTCLHASDTKNEKSVLALKIELKKDEKDGTYEVFTFESVEHDGVENVILAEFGALSLESEIGVGCDGLPIPFEREEDGTYVGYKSLTINVKYGRTNETPTPAPTPTPSTEPSSTPTPTPTPIPDVDIRDEIPYAENVPVDEKETVIKEADTDKNDVEGSVYQYLKLKPASVKKNSIKIKWQKIKGADGYIIYGNKCGSKMEYITTIKKATATSYTAKKLKKGTYYKYLVVAYKTTASGDKVITTSKSVHIVTTGGKKGNPTSLKLKKSKFTLKKGKTAKIKASFKKKKRVATHIAKFRYESTDPAVATVSKSGKVKAVGKGSCKINVYTQNGLMKTVSIKVK